MMSFRNHLCLPVGAALVMIWTSCAPVDAPDDKPARKTEASVANVYPIPSQPSLSSEASAAAGNDRLLKQRIEAVIDQVRQRELLLNNGFWTVFHGILGLGPSVTLKHPVLGVQVNAVDYIC